VNMDGAVTALQQEREKLVRQLAELGATESGDLTGDVEFSEGFADAAAATAERSKAACRRRPGSLTRQGWHVRALQVLWQGDRGGPYGVPPHFPVLRRLQAAALCLNRAVDWVPSRPHVIS
jgi:hypothetical protein